MLHAVGLSSTLYPALSRVSCRSSALSRDVHLPVNSEHINKLASKCLQITGKEKKRENNNNKIINQPKNKAKQTTKQNQKKYRPPSQKHYNRSFIFPYSLLSCLHVPKISLQMAQTTVKKTQVNSEINL